MYKHSYKKKEDSNIIYVKQDAELVEEFDPVLKVEKAVEPVINPAQLVTEIKRSNSYKEH